MCIQMVCMPMLSLHSLIVYGGTGDLEVPLVLVGDGVPIIQVGIILIGDILIGIIILIIGIIIILITGEAIADPIIEETTQTEDITELTETTIPMVIEELSLHRVEGESVLVVQRLAE